MHPGNWQHNSHVGPRSTHKSFMGGLFPQHVPTDVVQDRAYNGSRIGHPQSMYPHVSSGGHQIGQMQMFSGYPTQSQGLYMFHHHVPQELPNMSQHSASQQSIGQNMSHPSVQVADDRQLESAATKKKNFEEQQRKLKLMSSRQKQPTGHRTVDELMKSTDLNLTGAIQSGFSKAGGSQVFSSGINKEPSDPLRSTNFIQSYSAKYLHGAPNQSTLPPYGSDDFGSFEGFPSVAVVPSSKPAMTSALTSHGGGGPATTSANQFNTAFSASRPVGNILHFPAESLSSVPNEKAYVAEMSSLGTAQQELPRHNNSSAMQPFSAVDELWTSSEVIAEFGDFSVAKTTFAAVPNFVSNVNSENTRDKTVEFGDFCALPASDGTSILGPCDDGESEGSGLKSEAGRFKSYGTAGIAFTSDKYLSSFGGPDRRDPASGLHSELQNKMQIVMGPKADFGNFSTYDGEQRAAFQAFSGQSKTPDPLLGIGSGRENEDAMLPEKLYGSPLPEWCLSPGALPAVFHNVLKVCRSFDGSVDTSKLQPILMSSKLTKEQLGYIWDSANKKTPGIIDEIELYLILGLVALAQAGWTKLSVAKLASCKTAPIPEFPEHILTQQDSFVSEAEAYAGVDDGPIDPNDKYSAFRMINRSDGESASNTDQCIGLPNDTNWADWGALPALKSHTNEISVAPAEDENGWAFFKSSEVDQTNTVFVDSKMAEGVGEFAAFKTFNRYSESSQRGNIELDNPNISTVVAADDLKVERTGGQSSNHSRDVNTSSSTAYGREPAKTKPIFLQSEIKDSFVLAEQPRFEWLDLEDPSCASQSSPFSSNVEIQASTSGLKQPSSKGVVQVKPTEGGLPVYTNSGASGSSGLASLKRSTSYGEVKLETELNALYLGYDSAKPSYSGGLSSKLPSDIDVAETEFGSFTQFDNATHAGDRQGEFGNFDEVAPPVPTPPNLEGGAFIGDAKSLNWEFQAAGKGEPLSTSSFSDGFFPDAALASSDRYQALTGEMQDGERHVEDWKRCLQSVINVLEQGVSLIRQHSLSISARREVVQDPKGKEYFDGLKEIYAVAARLKVSVQNAALARGNTDLVSLTSKVDNLWNELKNFLAGVSEIGHLNGLDMSSLHMGEEADLAKSCGICLLNTDMAPPPSSLVEWMLNSSFFTYGGKAYHATCANFWCNKVSSVLPALQPLTSGLL